MLVLAPVMCILAGIGVSATLTTYMKNLDPLTGPKKTETAAKKGAKKASSDYNYPIKNEVPTHLCTRCITNSSHSVLSLPYVDCHNVKAGRL